MSMRESTRRVVSTTPTRCLPDVRPVSRYLRFYLIPEAMARLRQHQRDADAISLGVNPDRLGAIPYRFGDYQAWCESAPRRRWVR